MCVACLILPVYPYGNPTLYVSNSDRLQFKSCIICSCLLFYLFKCSKICSHVCVAFCYVNVAKVTETHANGFSDYHIVYVENKELIIKSPYWTAKSVSTESCTELGLMLALVNNNYCIVFSVRFVYRIWGKFPQMMASCLTNILWFRNCKNWLFLISMLIFLLTSFAFTKHEQWLPCVVLTFSRTCS